MAKLDFLFLALTIWSLRGRPLRASSCPSHWRISRLNAASWLNWRLWCCHDYFLPPPSTGAIALTGFLTADRAFVIALRIELLADDFPCAAAAERADDALLVFPYSSATLPTTGASVLTEPFLLLIARRIEFDADERPCPVAAEREFVFDDLEAIVFPCWCWIPVYD